MTIYTQYLTQPRRLLADSHILEKYKVKSIALFGSYVRNGQSRGSDIDFLVEFKESTFRNYVGLLSELEGLFGKKLIWYVEMP